MNNNAPEITPPKDSGGVYRLSGDIVYSTVPAFVQAEDDLFAQLEKDVVVDCSALKRVDSAGISLLLEWKRQCQQQQKQCLYQSLPTQAVSLINTFKLQSLLL